MTSLPNGDPFTASLLHSITGTMPAQPNETEAMHAERLAIAAAALAAFHPRDAVEQMLAAQIVSTHYAAIDHITRAARATDPSAHQKLYRTYAMLYRTMADGMQLLAERQKRPAEVVAQPLPIIETIPPPRRRPPE